MIIECEVAGGDPWPEGTLEAQQMCRKGAEQGHAGAQHSLGRMYLEGEGGLPCDDELALFWFNKAAENDEEFPPPRKTNCNTINHKGAMSSFGG